MVGVSSVEGCIDFYFKLKLNFIYSPKFISCDFTEFELNFPTFH